MGLLGRFTGFALLFSLFFPLVYVLGAPGDTDAPQNSPEIKQEDTWNGTVPEVVRRPQRGEAPRYPRDIVIGDLGRGDAPEETYTLAKNLLNALVSGNKTAPAISALDKNLAERLLTKLQPINPRKFRIGGGQEEADSGVSFLVRFIGREQWISGELYLKLEEGGQTRVWLTDDLVLEDQQDISASKEPYPYEFSPYERFF
jgi:hypothetical protein